MTILVIDDDAELRELVTRSLTAEGHMVIPAETAEQGLEQLPFHRFDVAFLDHHLPGMEGLVLGEYLKGNNPEMQITLVTGGADARIARLVDEYGLGLVHKPFDLDELFVIVNAHADAQRARRSAEEARAAPEHHPDFARHLDVVAGWYRGFNVPRRLEAHLGHRVREALDGIRFDGGDPERLRVAALAGLLAAEVLGVKLPRERDGRTLARRYDEMMRATGRAPAFEAVDPPGRPA